MHVSIYFAAFNICTLCRLFQYILEFGSTSVATTISEWEQPIPSNSIQKAFYITPSLWVCSHDVSCARIGHVLHVFILIIMSPRIIHFLFTLCIILMYVHSRNYGEFTFEKVVQYTHLRDCCGYYLISMVHYHGQYCDSLLLGMNSGTCL